MDYNTSSFAQPFIPNQHDAQQSYNAPVNTSPTFSQDFYPQYAAQSGFITPSHHFPPQQSQQLQPHFQDTRQYQYDHHSRYGQSGQANGVAGQPGIDPHRGRDTGAAYSMMADSPLPSEHELMNATPEQQRLMLQLLQERRRIKEIELQLMEERRKEREMNDRTSYSSDGDDWRRTGVQGGQFGIGLSAVTGKRNPAIHVPATPVGSGYLAQERQNGQLMMNGPLGFDPEVSLNRGMAPNVTITTSIPGTDPAFAPGGFHGSGTERSPSLSTDSPGSGHQLPYTTYDARATLSSIADRNRAAVTAAVMASNIDEQDGEDSQHGQRKSTSTSPPHRYVGSNGHVPPRDLTAFDSLRLHDHSGRALSSHGESTDGSMRGSSSTPDHFYPMPPPPMALIAQQSAPPAIPVKHPRLSASVLLPTAVSPTTDGPSGKKARKQLIERPIICNKCEIPICKLLLRGFAEEMNESEFTLQYECQKCIIDVEIAKGARGAAVATAKQARKRTRQTEDTSMPTVCDVCVRTLGKGGLVPKVRDAPLNFTTEIICYPCGNKYQRCSDCGGGSGRVGVGKWRAKEVFEHGRKTCRLPHVRLGGGELEISVWELPHEVEQYKGGRDLPALMTSIKTLWNEKIVARLAIPEVLEGGDPELGYQLVPGEEPVQRSYADVEEVIARGWPARETLLRTVPSLDHDLYRRYLGLSWTKSRARRDRAAGKLPDASKYPADSKDVVAENVRRTAVLVPPACQLVGMWIIDWDIQKRTLLLSTSVPFETSDAEDRNIIGIGEVMTRIIEDWAQQNQQYPDRPFMPPLHLWVATRSISAAGNARITDTLTRRRGFLPVDEYISVHPGTDRSIFEHPPDGHAWIDEPSWVKPAHGSPTSGESADLEILVRWLGEDFNTQRMEELKEYEYGKKSKETQITAKTRRAGFM